MMLPWPLLGFQLAQSIIHHSLSSSAIKHSPLPLSAGICCNPPAIVVLTERSHLRSGQPDSLYGSRHLAERMAHTPHPLGSTHTNLLQAVVRHICVHIKIWHPLTLTSILGSLCSTGPARWSRPFDCKSL